MASKCSSFYLQPGLEFGPAVASATLRGAVAEATLRGNGRRSSDPPRGRRSSDPPRGRRSCDPPRDLGRPALAAVSSYPIVGSR